MQQRERKHSSESYFLVHHRVTQGSPSPFMKATRYSSLHTPGFSCHKIVLSLQEKGNASHLQSLSAARLGCLIQKSDSLWCGYRMLSGDASVSQHLCLHLSQSPAPPPHPELMQKNSPSERWLGPPAPIDSTANGYCSWNCLTREKSKVKFTCVLVVKVKAQDYCEQPLWGA